MNVAFGDIEFDDTTYSLNGLNSPIEKRMHSASIRGVDGAVRLDVPDMLERTFRLEGSINTIDEGSYEDAKSRLREVLARKGEQKLRLSGGRYFWAECTSFVIPEESQDPFGANFSATLVSHDPYEYAARETSVTANPSGWTRITAGQNGNAPVAPVVRITGPVTNPKIIAGDALLQARLEGALTASRGQALAHSGTAAYAQGRWGDAHGAVVCNGDETLVFTLKGNIDESKGTLCFNWFHNNNSIPRELVSLAADFKLKLSAGRQLSFFNGSADLEWDYALSNQTWYHVAITWDVDRNERHLYVDAYLVASGNYTKPALTGNATLTPDGRVCDLRVYSQALNLAEVDTIYTGAADDYVDDYASLEYVGTVSSSQTLLIDCGQRAVTLNGASVLGDVQTVGDDFPRYPSSHRDLLYDHASGTPALRASFKDRYL